MTFSHPTYLWGLFSLLLPILIHLLNQGDVKTVKVGSVKYLSEQDTKQSRKIKINEFLLLALRLLLLALLVLAMAGPKWKVSNSKTPITYLIEPSLFQNEQIKSFLDSLPSSQVKLLANGFPDIDEYDEVEKEPNYWQLVQKIPVLGADSIVVFSKGLLQGVKGRRPVVSENINWMVLDDGQGVNEYIGAWVGNDSIELLAVDSRSQRMDISKKNILKSDNRVKGLGGDSLYFSSEKRDFNIPVWKKDTIQIGLVFDPEYEKEKHFIEAALKAVGKYGKHPVSIIDFESGESTIDSNSQMDLWVWLSNNSGLKTTATTIAFRPDSLAGKLIVPGERKNLYLLTQRLNIESALNEGLAKDLAYILLKNDSIQNMVDSYDLRVLAEEEIAPVFKDLKKSSVRVGTMNVSRWLWLLSALFLLFERILSKIKKQ